MTRADALRRQKPEPTAPVPARTIKWDATVSYRHLYNTLTTYYLWTPHMFRELTRALKDYEREHP